MPTQPLIEVNIILMMQGNHLGRSCAHTAIVNFFLPGLRGAVEGVGVGMLRGGVKSLKLKE